ncbi:hypothetical protein RYX36_022256, partial [Vicia faba]
KEQLEKNDASLHGDNVTNDSKLSYVPLPGVGQLDVTKSRLKKKSYSLLRGSRIANNWYSTAQF